MAHMVFTAVPQQPRQVARATAGNGQLFNPSWTEELRGRACLPEYFRGLLWLFL